MSETDVAVVCHDHRHTALLIKMHFPVVIETRGSDDEPFAEPPFDAMEAWCAETFETGDAFIVQGDDRTFYPERRWCLFGGVFRFKNTTDATAFKLRWV